MPNITLRISDALASALDERRGEIARNAWVSSVVEQTLQPGAVLVSLGEDRGAAVAAMAVGRGISRSALLLDALESSVMAEGVKMPLSRELIERIDLARGETSRAAWCLAAFELALNPTPLFAPRREDGQAGGPGGGRLLSAPDAGRTPSERSTKLLGAVPAAQMVGARPLVSDRAHSPTCKCAICKPPRES